MKMIRSHNPLVTLTGDWFDQNFDPLSSFSRLMNWVDRSSPLSSLGGRTIPVDLYEDAEAFHARFEVPGVKREQLSLELGNGVLALSCRHGEATGQPASAGDSENSASSYAEVRRSVPVPEGIAANRVTADLRDGVLTVHLPKADEHRVRTIEVS